MHTKTDGQGRVIMSFKFRLTGLFLSLILLCVYSFAVAAPPGGSPGKKGGGSGSTGLTTISSRDWGETPVRKILRAFAFGGLADDEQIGIWAGMSPEAAILEMLTFDPVNPLLSPPPTFWPFN